MLISRTSAQAILNHLNLPSCGHCCESAPALPASDELFYWLFQEEPDRILQCLPDLTADASGYQFTAPVL